MLVLTRKVKESIIIGEDIEITVARICRNEVRVGITAPRHIPVYRKEIALFFTDSDNTEGETKCQFHHIGQVSA